MSGHAGNDFEGRCSHSKNRCVPDRSCRYGASLDGVFVGEGAAVGLRLGVD